MCVPPVDQEEEELETVVSVVFGQICRNIEIFLVEVSLSRMTTSLES